MSMWPSNDGDFRLRDGGFQRCENDGDSVRMTEGWHVCTCPPLHCLYIFIQLRRLRHREEKIKCPNFKTVAKGIRTRALSIASPAFYHWATAFRKIRNLTYLNAIDVLVTNYFSTFAHRILHRHTNEWLRRINCITSVYRQLIVHKPMRCSICGDWFSYLLMPLTQRKESVVAINGWGNWNSVLLI